MKLAVVFPGIGYHVDKPLLFYSKKIAASHGFEVAAEYAGSRQIQMKNVYYTPVKESKAFMEQPGIVFHGTVR